MVYGVLSVSLGESAETSEDFLNCIAELGETLGEALRMLLTVRRLATATNEGQQAIQASLSHFQQLYLDSPVPMIIHDRETGQLRDCNRRAWELYGCDSMQQLREQQPWLEPPYSFKEALSLIRKAWEDGSAEVLWKARRLDGAIMWHQVHLSRFDMRGEGAVLVAFFDVTEREAALRKIRESEDRYVDLVRTVGGFSWEVDLTGKYTYVGDTIRGLLGWEPEEVLALSSCFELMPEDGYRFKT